MTALGDILTNRQEAIRPDPVLTVSQWADLHRILTSKESGIPGQWDTNRTPYLREVMNRMGVTDQATREVVLKCASQLGKTEFTNNALGYWMDCAPGPSMFVQPTTEMLKEWSRDRLDSMIEGTPRLRAKVTEKKSRDSANTIAHKSFPGGSLAARTAGSASGLQSSPRRYYLGDETDKWPINVDGAGSPVENIRQRAASYSNSKGAWTSTPGLTGASTIDDLYREGDQRQYWVPCQRCGVYELLLWKDFVWTDLAREPEDAAWRCPTCGGISESHEIHAMNDRGHWIPSLDVEYTVAADDTIETGYKIKSYYLPGWYSPWPKSSWGAIASQFVKAKGNPEKLTAWTNLREGLSYDHDAGERPDAGALIKMLEPIGGVVPNRAKVLTAVTDIQGDRSETKIKAWGPGEESWLIDYVILRGDPDSESFWNDLHEALSVKYTREDGRLMVIACALIDSGYKSDRVYAFCAGKGQRRIWPIKGLPSTNYMAPIWPRRPVRAGKGKIVDRFDVNVNEAKSTAYARLAMTAKAWEAARKESEETGQTVKVPTGPGLLHFDEGHCDGEYFAQLTGEVRAQRAKSGKTWFEFIKVRERNEALDLEGYSIAALRALQSMRLTLGQHEAASTDESDPRPAPSPPKPKTIARKRSPRSTRPGWGKSRQW